MHRAVACAAGLLFAAGLTFATMAVQSADNGQNQGPPSGPPATERTPVTDEMHGESIVDPYRWLESLEADSEAVREWTTKQNDYTRAVLESIPGRAALEERLGELLQVGSIGTPQMRGNLYFYTEREGDQNQPVLYVRHGVRGEPRPLLDVNGLDEEGLYALDWWEPNPDGSLVAFGLSYAGDEMTVAYIMETASGKWLADEIQGKVDFSGWAPGGRAFLYSILERPEDAYSRATKWHVVGRHHRMDPVLLRQEEPSRIPWGELSDNGRWISVVYFEGWAKQDLYAVDTRAWLRTGKPEMTPVAEGLDARFSPAGVVGDTLYLFTTLDAPNGRLIAVNLNDPVRENWVDVIPHREDAVLNGASLAKGMLVANYQKNATTRLERFTLDGESLGQIWLPGLGSATIETHHDRNVAFIKYESFNEPDSVYFIDLRTDEHELWERPEVPVDPELLTVRQEWATSKDGTQVPMFIVHRTDLEPSGDEPTLIYGYGGFNQSIDPWFNATYFPWLERGGVFVAANLRGGGEFGEAWHKGGMLDQKQNVFDDLYAVAEHLIDEGYTNPQHLAVLGGSNGGLLTGVAAVQRPDLWAAVVSAVPLLDMLRYQNFLMAKFWVPEYGDPENPEHYQWLRAYSPYHNIEPGRAYPAILFTAGENDNRVHPLHARKMAAALQHAAANDFSEDPILLWVDREAGHGQGKPLHLQLQEIADRWSFIMWQTGMMGENAAD